MEHLTAILNDSEARGQQLGDLMAKVRKERIIATNEKNEVIRNLRQLRNEDKGTIDHYQRDLGEALYARLEEKVVGTPRVQSARPRRAPRPGPAKGARPSSSRPASRPSPPVMQPPMGERKRAPYSRQTATPRTKRIQATSKVSQVSQATKLTFRRIMQKIREQTMNTANKKMSGDDAPNIRQVFESFDTDGSGVIDELEFQTGLREMGVDISGDELAALFTFFELDGQPGCDYDEFCWAFYNRRALDEGSMPFSRSAKQRSTTPPSSFPSDTLQLDLSNFSASYGVDSGLLISQRSGDSGHTSRRSTFMDPTVSSTRHFESDERSGARTAREGSRQEAVRSSWGDSLGALGLDAADIGLGTGPEETAAVGNEVAGNMDKKLKVVMEKIRAAAYAKSRGAELHLDRVFRKMDQNGNGVLERGEFSNALEQLGCGDLSAEDRAVVFSVFDRDGGGIEYGEFCWAFYNRRMIYRQQAQMGQERKVQDELPPVTMAALDRLQNHISQDKSNVVSQFRIIDKDCSGTVSVKELQQGFEEMGITMSKGEWQGIMKVLDTNQNGIVEYDELLELMARYGKEKRERT